MTKPSRSPMNGPLSNWQKIQGAMLYHYASLEYLKGLHRLVCNLANGAADPMLASAAAQDRDSVLTNPRWGTRNTSKNWSNNAWPFLKDLQASLAKDIANRAFESYRISGVNECFRGISEFSLQWATLAEEHEFDEAVKAISLYASKIDQTLDDYDATRWEDSEFAYLYKDFVGKTTQIPRLRVRTDITGESGKKPGRTGVYVAQDDPHAALQFAWVGQGGGKLRASSTFNEIGLAALQKVGRKDLWVNDQKMFDFAMQRQYETLFRPDIYVLGKEYRRLASPAVADAAFVNRPCRWFFAEIVNREFDDIEDIEGVAPTEHAAVVARLAGGEVCKRTGFYFTPAHPNSRRRLAQGQAAPNYNSQYGKTIWQWNERQD
jgi:hypothetical protein